MSGEAATGSIWRRRPAVRVNRPLAGDFARTEALDFLDRAESERDRPRIGLLGGSFNPAHDGHRAISLEALKRLGLDQVWWLISPQNPLKSKTGMADLETRTASARKIAGGHPGLVVTNLEQKIGTRYTVDTVKWLVRNGKNDFVWLIGADNLMQLPMWRAWKTLLNLVPIAVFDREPYSYKALAGKVAHAYAAKRIDESQASSLVRADPPAWVYFRLRRHRISSTAIRAGKTWPDRQPAGKEA